MRWCILKLTYYFLSHEDGFWQVQPNQSLHIGLIGLEQLLKKLNCPWFELLFQQLFLYHCYTAYNLYFWVIVWYEIKLSNKNWIYTTMPVVLISLFNQNYQLHFFQLIFHSFTYMFSFSINLIVWREYSSTFIHHTFYSFIYTFSSTYPFNYFKFEY